MTSDRNRLHCRPASGFAAGRSTLDEGQIRQEILAATDQELIVAIRRMQSHALRPEADAKLDGFDRDTLERLAYLSWRCCQSRRQPTHGA